MKTQFDVPYSQQHQDWRRMDWFLPDQANGNAILMIHGGGWSGGSKQQWHAVARHFCERGYCCAAAAYRLVPHGVFADQIADVRLAMATMRRRAAEYGFRTDRVAALGSSAGGHLTAMLATIADDDDLGVEAELENRHTRPDLAICYCPVLCVYDRGPVKGFFNATTRTFLGGDFSELPDRFRQASPLDRITGTEPPFLFLHGDADSTVPLRHSTEMHRLLLEAGAASDLVVLPEVGHGFGYGVTSAAQQQALVHIERFRHARWS